MLWTIQDIRKRRAVMFFVIPFVFIAAIICIAALIVLRLASDACNALARLEREAWDGEYSLAEMWSDARKAWKGE